MSKNRLLLSIIIISLIIGATYFSGFLGTITQAPEHAGAVTMGVGGYYDVTALDKDFGIWYENHYNQFGLYTVYDCIVPEEPPLDTAIDVYYTPHADKTIKVDGGTIKCDGWVFTADMESDIGCAENKYRCEKPKQVTNLVIPYKYYYVDMGGDTSSDVKIPYDAILRYGDSYHPIPFDQPTTMDADIYPILLRGVYYDFETDEIYRRPDGLRSYIRIWHNQVTSIGHHYVRFDYFVTEDSFDISINDFETSVFETDVVDVVIDVDNKEPIDMYGQLKVTYNLKTFFGIFNITETKDVSVNSGMNTYTFTIPTEELTENLMVTPELTVYIDSSEFQSEIGFEGTPTTKVNTITFDTYGMLIQDIELLEILRLEGEILTKAEIITNLTANKDEQAQVILMLQQSAEDNALLIQNMYSELDDQLDLISAMELTIAENIALLKKMDLEIAGQLKYIDTLTDNLAEKMAYIKQLELSNDEMAIYILELTANKEEQAIAIINLENTNKENALLIQTMYSELADQLNLIGILELTIADNVALLNSMDLTIQEQLIAINTLAKNVEEKQQYITELTALIDDMGIQAEILNNAITELNLDNAELSGLIAKLDNKISEDAELIQLLNLSNEDLIQQVLLYKGNLADSQALVGELNLEIDQLIAVIDEYKGQLVVQAGYITELELSNQQQAEIIIGLNLNLADMTELISNLNNKVIEDAGIITNLQLSNEGLLIMVAEYKDNLVKSAQLAKALGLENDQLLLLIDGYKGNLADQAKYIAELELLNEEELELIALLNLSLDDQDTLKNYLLFYKSITIVSLLALVLIGCSVLIYFARK
ncbi:MAG: hypothetical protein KAS32_18555 [Candidatus Peribacteraceae bacterium]|nr:hypothetical protein [Candidatus Peribacteraceae bacterium]